jgi:hypothetical protein
LGFLSACPRRSIADFEVALFGQEVGAGNRVGQDRAEFPQVLGIGDPLPVDLGDDGAS